MASYEVPLTQAQRDISIAEIAVFSASLVIRLLQNYRGRSSNDKKTAFLRDGIVLFCLVRIIGASLYLAAKSPADSILIGALILESLGSTFLLGELSRLLVGYLDRPKPTTPPHATILRRTIQLLRIPIVLAMALFITAYNLEFENSTVYRALIETGAVVILVVYAIYLLIYLHFALHFSVLVGEGTLSFYCAVATLPFLLVRLLYLVLAAFRVDDGEFVVIFGDWKYEVGMSFVMEVVVVGLLLVGGYLAEREMRGLVGGDAESGSMELRKAEAVEYGSR